MAVKPGRLALVPLLLAIVVACDAAPTEVGCTLELPRAVDIQLKDSLTGEILHAPANITATVRPAGEAPSVNSALPTDSIAGGINGGPATYDILVSRVGYAAKSAVVVVAAKAGPCHKPERQFILIRLRPS